jgi:hypothetical protein
MKLSQDLMQLFVEYQVPSDLLSYDGESSDSSIRDKVENVRTHVKVVMDVVDAAKDKQLEEQTKKAENSFMARVQYTTAEAEETTRRVGRKMTSKGDRKMTSKGAMMPFGGGDGPQMRTMAMSPAQSARQDGFHTSASDRGLMTLHSKKSKKSAQTHSFQPPAPLQETAALQASDYVTNTKSVIAASKEVGVSTLEELQRQRKVIQNIETQKLDGGEDYFVE